jgi:hypothetical protein
MDARETDAYDPGVRSPRRAGRPNMPGGASMFRIIRALVVALAMLLSVAGVATAKHDQGCTKNMSPIELNVGWELADGVPDSGEDDWWDNTVAGFAAEGLSLDDAAALFGQPTVLALYEMVLTGVLAIDENGDGVLCYRAFPEQQNGTPAYIFLVDDNKHI